MKVAFVGCGFVADLYIKTLRTHANLEFVGVYDRDAARMAAFCAHYGVPSLADLDAVFSSGAEIVVNLTNPASHYEVTRACLEAGKHVYTEKPLATDMGDARELAALAQRLGLHLGSAPCSHLSETAQTMWSALRDEIVGPVRLVYAEVDDGMLHKMGYRNWISEAGAPWPYEDEFESGCVLEHAGYILTWLTLFFGPATSVTSFTTCLIPDKGVGTDPEPDGADFSVACIEFASKVVARVTVGLVAPRDRSLQIIGDEGVLLTENTWDYSCPVYLRKRGQRKDKKIGPSRKQRYKAPYASPSHQMDFARGIAEMADAILEDRPCRLTSEHAMHVAEIMLRMDEANHRGGAVPITSTFAPIEPAAWAESV